MTEWEATLVEDAAGLERLEPEWRTLWRRAPEATPFQSPAWLIAWWTAFHPGALFTVAIRRGGTLAALAPLYIEDGASGRRILPLGISVSDYLDVLIDPDCREPAADALVGAVESLSDRWDGWDLEELRPGAAAFALPCPSGCTETAGPQSACPVLPIEAGDPWRSTPAWKRRKVKLARNRAGRRATEIAAAAPEGGAEALDALFRLHAARWESRGEPGVLADPAVRRFHELAAPRLAREGLLNLVSVTIDGTVAGILYGLRHRGAAFAYLAGFDPAFAFESPGALLVAAAIEEAAKAGLGEFHFLRGQEPYKYEWGAADRWNGRRSFRKSA